MREYTTADLCDDNQDKNIKVLPASFKNYGGRKIFSGKVITIKLVKSNWDLIDLLKEEDGIGKIIVVDAQKAHYGIIGDKLSFLAQKAKFEAIIVNGYVRDTMETKKFPIGLMAIGTCPLRNFEKTKGIRGCTLNFDDTLIEEGDYLYADEDGVIISDQYLL